MHKTTPTPALPAALLLALAAALTGCSWVNELKLPLITQEGKELPESPETRAQARSWKYPANLPVGEPVDIEVIRDGKAIRLDNRAVRRFENVELWLNHEYGAEVPALEIGRSEPISLKNFQNEHGEDYPTARFLYPDADKPLVMADIILDGKIHKLTVRLVEDWRRP